MFHEAWFPWVPLWIAVQLLLGTKLLQVTIRHDRQHTLVYLAYS